MQPSDTNLNSSRQNTSYLPAHLHLTATNYRPILICTVYHKRRLMCNLHQPGRSVLGACTQEAFHSRPAYVLEYSLGKASRPLTNLTHFQCLRFLGFARAVSTIFQERGKRLGKRQIGIARFESVVSSLLIQPHHCICSTALAKHII